MPPDVQKGPRNPEISVLRFGCVGAILIFSADRGGIGYIFLPGFAACGA
jgi:hypothetical protein